MTIPDHVRDFWQQFLATRQDPDKANRLFYESFGIGYDDREAEIGAQLILAGKKTATSALLWKLEESMKPLPSIGSLSVVEDGRRAPKCVIETTWVDVIPFGLIDADFARAYGETDGTLEGWRELIRECYTEDCRELGRTLSEETPLVCERFRVVY